jgi:NhaC family Na+:H+ antiporter
VIQEPASSIREKMNTKNNGRQTDAPSLVQSIVCFTGIFAMISCGLFVFQVSLHAIMFLCLIWTSLHAMSLGHNFVDIRSMMNGGISRALPAIYIFILIGMVIASYMQSGTIASLIYYGLNLLTPGIFLAAGFVLSSLMSVATGTSWGTVGTIGVVLVGIGGAMGIPLPLVVGMIVSGATFGDKLSPISDTTNLAAMSAETQLYRHIGSMLYTTTPTFLLVLVLFAFIGYQYAGQTLPVADINQIQQALQGSYGTHLGITLLPLVVMLVLGVRRYTPEVSMTGSILTALAIAVLYQGQGLVEALNSLWSNPRGTTGIDNIDELLGRGGITSMSWTLLLSLMALALGGILHDAGFLRALLQGLIAKLRRTTALIASTIGAGFVGNMAMGEAYITIILNSQLFKGAYAQQRLNAAVLSRSVEEGATMTTGLIPWTTAGAFYAATLGVSALDYAPYAFFNYLNPVVSITMASAGLGLLGSWRSNVAGDERTA